MRVSAELGEDQAPAGRRPLWLTAYVATWNEGVLENVTQ